MDCGTKEKAALSSKPLGWFPHVLGMSGACTGTSGPHSNCCEPFFLHMFKQVARRARSATILRCRRIADVSPSPVLLHRKRRCHATRVKDEAPQEAASAARRREAARAARATRRSSAATIGAGERHSRGDASLQPRGARSASLVARLCCHYAARAPALPERRGA